MRNLSELDWPRHTARLTVRRARAADAETVFAYRSEGDVSRWLARGADDEREFCDWFCSAENLDHALILEREGRVIGDVKVEPDDSWVQGEVAHLGKGVEARLAWCLAPSARGRGYATEAVSELLRLCFDELDVRRVTAGCFADNEPSWRLMERVGMRRESHLVGNALLRTGEWVDGLIYGILADEWRAAQAMRQDCA